VRRPIRKRELLARIERLEKTLATPLPAPLPGQQALPVALVRDHHYEGSGGPCTADTFGIPCRAPHDAHRPQEDSPA